MAGLGSSLVPLGDSLTPRAPVFEVEIDDGILFQEGAIIANKRYNESDAFGIGVAPLQTPYWMIGRIISEVVYMQSVLSPKMTYGLTIAEQGFIAQALGAASVAVIADVIYVQPIQTAVQAVTVLQGLGIAPTPLPTLKYTQTLMDGLAISPLLLNFFGATLSDAIYVHEGLAPQFRANPEIDEQIYIAPLLSQLFTMRVTITDHIDVDDTQILKMLYSGEALQDGIQIITGYVSPDGQFSTWAMNTRSGAITEYTNYAFNSFTQMGDICYGASATGLYQLLGDDDAGTSIIAQLRSGFAQWGQSKFALLKRVYIGMRGEGTWVLKIITGDDKEYVYQTSTRNQRTTRVHVGKGIRSRYIAFELVSAGQDFDLDTIEFVPLVADRRV